jgi:sulfate permease, SulP family
MSVVPGWVRTYQRRWLGADLVAGVIIWSVVVPQATAYAQIAGLPPAAGLVAAPGALIGYALLGGSRTLVVSATTATSALSAAAVGPLAQGDTPRFLALSAALALLAAAVLAAGGALRLGALSDLVSKPVMTGFLFGLGMTITVGQLPKLLGVPDGSGDFFPRLSDLLGDLGHVHWATVAIGVGSLVALVVLRRRAPAVPGTLIVLGAAIAISALLGLDDHGVDVVGKLPNALPDPTIPDVSWRDTADLLPAAFGVMVLSTEAVGVARSLAAADHYDVNANRELVALGTGNLLAGISGGFVQSGGASQTLAAERAGAKTQLAAVISAGLILLTGAFLAPVFTDLPQATLAAIVIVAISGFFDVVELRRLAGLRTSAIVFALVALVGVLVLGVLQGLLVAAGLSLVILIQRLSRPPVRVLARDPATGAWDVAERHPDHARPDEVIVARVDGPLFYANSQSVKDHLLALARQAPAPPRGVVLELDQTDIDVQSVDMLGELAEALSDLPGGLTLARARRPVLDLLRRAGVDRRVRLEPTIDTAVDALTRSG